ncbi:MAG: S8 family serine peptidase [Saprospirales bacterium]|nr:S8 family serine peptidase [Saprospirales bacterium]
MKLLTKCIFAVCCALFLSFNAKGQGQGYAPGDLIVQLQKGVDVKTLVERMQAFQGNATHLTPVRFLSPPLNIWLLNFDETAVKDRDFLDFIRIQPEVQLAQFNHYITERNVVPDDPQFASQWQWVNNGGGGALADADVDADEAWEITTGGGTATGHEIVVAVVESGINVAHPDLVANIWHNNGEIANNFIDDDNNGYLDDYDGWNVGQDNDNIPSGNHGTAVSGMIGAVGNNGVGVSGINWDVKIMAVAMQGVFEANVVEAYTYPYVLRKQFNDSNGHEGAFVVAINSSWGIDGGQPADAPVWCSFYDTLGVEGILSCGATANNNVNIDVVGDLPTACPSEYMVAVTATNNADLRTFSGYGVEQIDLGAPGSNIFSTSGTNGYSSTSGTSFASPLTAGVIALMYSAPCVFLAEQAIVYPAETALQVRDALFAGVDIKSNLVPEVKTGGRVNAYKSLMLLLAGCGPCPAAHDLSAGSQTDVSAVLSWDGALDSQDNTIRFRPEGALEWDTIFNAGNPYELTGLTGCQVYEWQVHTICTDTTSGFSNSSYFETEGCCIPPDEVGVVTVGDESVLIEWNTVFAASGYLLTVDPLDTLLSSFTITPPPGNSFVLSGLAPCQGYSLSISTDCVGGAASSPSEAITFYTDCPCPAPLNADTSQVEMQTALYGWDSSENAGKYVVRYKELTAVDWILQEVDATSLLIEGLISCKNYRVQVKSVCPVAESGYTTALLFKTDCAPSSTEEPEVLTTELQVIPNPSHEQVKVWVTTDITTRATLEIFDPLGRRIWSNDLGIVQKGRHLFDLPNVPSVPGIYWMRLETEELILMEKMVRQ